MIELKILLTLLVANAIISLFNTPKGILGCGLVGFAPFEGKKANLEKIKILSIINSVRGTDSCGIFINNNLQKGVGKLSDIKDYFKEHQISYNAACKNKSIIVHMRKSTRGASIEANAHPFYIKENPNNPGIVGAHNGTIYNCSTLSKKYDVPYKTGDVDSKFLLTVIQKTKSFDVLAEYDGAAALLMAFEDEPNTIYAFKGASIETWGGSLVAEERPLYILIENEGVYFSSMREGLEIIKKDKKTDVLTISSNTVVRVTNNQIYKKQIVDRSHINAKTHVYDDPTYWDGFYERNNKTYSSSNFPRNSSREYNTFDDYIEEKNKKLTAAPIVFKRNASADKTIVKKDYVKSWEVKSPIAIYAETTSNRVNTAIYKDSVYFLGGRYFNFQELENEVYLKRGISPCDIDTRIPLVGTTQYGKDHLIDGFTKIETLNYFTYKVKFEDSIKISPALKEERRMFYKGVLIESNKQQAFIKKNMRARLDALKNIIEKTKQLSSYSAFPILPLFEESAMLVSKAKDKNSVKAAYYYRGKEYCGTSVFQPEYSQKDYRFEDGIPVEIMSVVPLISCFDTSYTKDVATNLKKEETVGVPFKLDGPDAFAEVLKDFKDAEIEQKAATSDDNWRNYTFPEESSGQQVMIMLCPDSPYFICRHEHQHDLVESITSNREKRNFFDYTTRYFIAKDESPDWSCFTGKEILDASLKIVFSNYFLENPEMLVEASHMMKTKDKAEIIQNLIKETKDCAEGILHYLESVMVISVEDFFYAVEEFIIEQMENENEVKVLAI